MRISLVGPVYPYRGGIAHYTGLLALALAQHHTVEVVSFKRQYPAFLYPGQSDRDPSGRPLQVPARYLLDPLYPWTWAQAVRQITRQQPEIAVVQWWTTFWAPGLAAVAGGLRRKGIPVVFVIHNVLPHEQRPWDRGLARLALRRGSAYIAQNRREAGRLGDLLPEVAGEDKRPGTKPVHVCPLPMYDFFAAGRTTRAAARAQLGLAPDEPALLFFGIVRPYKGLDYLIDALAVPPLRELKPTLLVAGEIWQDKADLEKKIAGLGLQGQVRLEDRYLPDEEVGVYFSAADAFVAPYVAGTQSAAIQAARAFGLPVVASHGIAQDAAGGADLWRAEPTDPADLARAVAAALQSGPSQAAIPSAPPQGEWDDLVRVIEELAGRLT